MKKVLATFSDRNTAERAVGELRSEGFEKEISVVSKDDKKADYVKQGRAPMTGGDPVSNGATTGGAVGGVLGLAAAAGALAIPGVGPILAAGPIAAALTGVAGGGLAGALVDFGIPKERGKYYENQVKQGKILVHIKCDDNKAIKAEDVLRRLGANDVESH